MYQQTTIDGQNLYDQFGAYVTKDGWNGLLAFPPLKAVKQNDWHEENGVDVDLSVPQLDTRTTDVKMTVVGHGNYQSFFRLWARGGAYHTLSDPTLPRPYKVRFVGVTGLSVCRDLYTFTLQVAEDAPPTLLGGSALKPSGRPPEGWGFDGIDFSDFGIRVLKGAAQSLREAPKAKINLLRNISSETGTEYDHEGVTYQQREVSLPLLMIDTDSARLWHNYSGLLARLVQANERRLKSPTHTRELPCYYKQMQVQEFFPDDHRFWLKFTLTLILTDGGKL